MGRGALQTWHIVVLLVVIVLLFGAKRLPDLAKSVGQSLKIFKSEVKDLKDDPSATPAATTPPPAAPTVPPATPTVQDAPAAPPADRPTEGGQPPAA